MPAVSQSNKELPPIPQKRYFTIGEASELCGVKTHVLRYWQKEFPQLTPTTRRGNRRYYQQQDILLIRQIRDLLYHQGFTISGAREQLQQANKQAKNSKSGKNKVTSSDELLAAANAQLQSLSQEAGFKNTAISSDEISHEDTIDEDTINEAAANKPTANAEADQTLIGDMLKELQALKELLAK